ncbi:actyltransferase-like protein [Leptomonas pyrrhocoris]|uniref:Actyltransferase-like protein n=1 Tax=Leptomonas pyrrhocoris TaxID=157538 RepID=A0A0M9FUS6_LEPPY|nr:actyltransferase-like protein [Leptomonas pyrrhocoris]KPA76510.1 actyltransferase-like protein [Leptomonas pyrrhocoris]|eukprot:XP_015654949.1 actyltransferase-like protein [Leptomonas pyrrhocoris]
MSTPAADDAASCAKATAALWSKLEEVLKLLAHQPDAKELFNRYTVIRYVVGEVKPVYSDALRIRLKVFCDEQGLATRTEADDFEAISVHVVTYFNYTLFATEMEELAVQARLRKSVGMEKTGLRFQRRQRNPAATGAGASGAAESKRPPTSPVAQPAKGRYRPPVLIPVGCMRLRRAAKAPRAGKLLEVVARMERLCVVKSVRNFDIGRVLMTAAENIARDVCHVRWALLYAPLAARDFYLKVGYVAKDGWVFFKAEEAHIVMIKCLADASL